MKEHVIKPGSHGPLETEEAIAEFKENKFYFSYSSLTKLITNPPLFYNDYVLKQREDISGKHLDVGELMHCLVLEPEEFDNKFYVLTCAVPGGKLRDVIESVFKTYMKPILEQDPNARQALNTFKDEILKELEVQDLYQSLTDAKRATNGVMLTGNQKRLEKAITDETDKYFLALQEAEGKTIIDMQIAQTAREKANAILTDPKASVFLTSNSIKEDVRNELELTTEFDNYPYSFGLKGIIDCVKIDYENEKIYITDLKTTSKTLDTWRKDFADSPYMYWLQCIVYKELILSLVPEDSKEAWTMEIRFIVIDKTNTVYPFKVSFASLTQFEYQTKECFDRAQWHLDNNSFKLPYEYEMELVEL